MRAGGVSYVILGALHLRPRSGYEIKQLVDNATRFFWAASYGQIYPELRRLRGEGLISAKSEPRGGRHRIVYSLTSAGRAELREWLLQGQTGYELRDEGLLKLFFADALQPDEATALLRAMRADRQAILERLREIERASAGVRHGFGSVVLDYGIGVHQWAVEWCERTERRLASPRKTTSSRKAGEG